MGCSFGRCVSGGKPQLQQPNAAPPCYQSPARNSTSLKRPPQDCNCAGVWHVCCLARPPSSWPACLLGLPAYCLARPPSSWPACLPAWPASCHCCHCWHSRAQVEDVDVSARCGHHQPCTAAAHGVHFAWQGHLCHRRRSGAKPGVPQPKGAAGRRGGRTRLSGGSVIQGAWVDACRDVRQAVGLGHCMAVRRRGVSAGRHCGCMLPTRAHTCTQCKNASRMHRTCPSCR